jgi:outer membrane protein assembly factor BamB
MGSIYMLFIPERIVSDCLFKEVYFPHCKVEKNYHLSSLRIKLKIAMKRIVILFTGLLVFNVVLSQNVNQWRGENRDGKYIEADLLKSWPEGGPELLWACEGLGAGYGSPIITQNAVYILGEVDSAAFVFAFDLEGRLKWMKNYGFEWNDRFPGTRSTPTLVGEVMYVTSGTGDIACLNIEDGEIVWQKNMIEDFNGRAPHFGYAQSLLVNDSVIYAMPGGVDTNIVALNRTTGEFIWISKANGEKPAYNSPRLIERGGKQILITYSQYSFMGIDVKDGKMIWSVSFEAKYPNHANTVLFEDNALYTFAPIGHGIVKYELAQDGRSIKEVWKDTVLGNYFGGFIKIEEKLYTGGGSRSKNTYVMNSNTGEVTDSVKTGSGSVIYADGMLYTYDHKKGTVCLVDPTQMEIKGSFKVPKGTKEHFSHPVICNGVLYIRHGEALMAYKIK